MHAIKINEEGVRKWSAYASTSWMRLWCGRCFVSRYREGVVLWDFHPFSYSSSYTGCAYIYRVFFFVFFFGFLSEEGIRNILKPKSLTTQPPVTCYYCINSGKLSREKTFTNFAVLEPPAKVFFSKFGHVVLTYDRFFSILWKFSLSKVSRYMVCFTSSSILRAGSPTKLLSTRGFVVDSWPAKGKKSSHDLWIKSPSFIKLTAWPPVNSTSPHGSFISACMYKLEIFKFV